MLTRASSNPAAVAKSSKSPAAEGDPRAPLTAAVSFRSRYRTPMPTAGAQKMASTVRIPHTPAPLPSMEAESSTTSAASERIPPTTGTAPDRAIRAAFPAAASAVPLIQPVTAMYPVKRYNVSFSAHSIPHRIRSRSFASSGSRAAAFATLRARNEPIMGTIRLFTTPDRMPSNAAVPT